MAKITYHQMKHVNLKRIFCHDPTKIGHKSRFSSHHVSFALGFVYPPNNGKTQKTLHGSVRVREGAD